MSLYRFAMLAGAAVLLAGAGGCSSASSKSADDVKADLAKAHLCESTKDYPNSLKPGVAKDGWVSETGCNDASGTPLTVIVQLKTLAARDAEFDESNSSGVVMLPTGDALWVIEATPRTNRLNLVEEVVAAVGKDALRCPTSKGGHQDPRCLKALSVG